MKYTITYVELLDLWNLELNDKSVRLSREIWPLLDTIKAIQEKDIDYLTKNNIVSAVV